MRSIVRRALGLWSLRFVSMQLGLALMVALLSAAWLRLPDSGIATVAATILLGAFLLALAFGGEASLLRRLGALPSAGRGKMGGSLALLVAAALWLAWWMLLHHLGLNDSMRAGYLNSRFPHSLRSFFSYGRLVLLLRWQWTVLQWLGGGLLLAFAIAAAQKEGWLRSLLRISGSATYWLMLAGSVALGTVVTGTLLGWTPGHGLWVEGASLLLRLGFVIVFDVALACWVLAVIAALVQGEEDDGYSTAAGTPE